MRDVILLAQRLEPFALMFLEDPVPPENDAALAKVTRSTPIPICTGEWRCRADGFRPLVERQACDLVPQGPGLGVELNEEVVNRHLAPGSGRL